MGEGDVATSWIETDKREHALLSEIEQLDQQP